MAMAEKSRFHRLLDILVPDGGAVVLMYEAYFDESGDFDEEPGVFCIAGYYIRSQDAALMDKEWADVLEKYGVPYFHMVDCAHGAPPFDGLSLHDRIQIVKDLINLVKQYTIDGFAIIGKKEFYLAENEDDDEYSRFVEMSVQAVERALDVDRISGPVSYFFETGHSRKGRAYNRVADKIANMPDSTITFGKKAEIRLLQAGDLLAWQCAKYAKDGVTGARGPRKDFLSLMEHRHMLAFLDARDGEPVISFEAYPLSRRSEGTVELLMHDSIQLASFTEGEAPIPIIPVRRAAGYRLGGGRMVYIGFEDMKENKFALAFDEMRIFEAIAMLTQGTGLYDHSYVRFLVRSVAVEQLDDAVMLTANIAPEGRLAFDLSKEAARNLIWALEQMIARDSGD